MFGAIWGNNWGKALAVTPNNYPMYPKNTQSKASKGSVHEKELMQRLGMEREEVARLNNRAEMPDQIKATIQWSAMRIRLENCH